MRLKELRKNKNLTQAECAKFLGVPLRTYQNYENDELKVKTIKYQFMIQKLDEYGLINENKGILTLKSIKDICCDIFKNYDIDFCYLFGSYSKGVANECSDVDLLISGKVSGLKFYELIELLREKLKKNVDVLTINQLKNNFELTKDILMYGVKIF